MDEPKTPRLRRASKYSPPYPLGKFPENALIDLGKEIVYLKATRETPRLEGPDWEEMFARIIGANWKSSNIGLDDVRLGGCAWGAKTVKHPNPLKAKSLRLISGRNSPTYSYQETIDSAHEPNDAGKLVLEIWNKRVEQVQKQFDEIRTVVLVKSIDLLTLVVFEIETVQYDHSSYEWSWNKNKNLVGHDASTGTHRFTWQTHGAQFTIHEPVPPNRQAIRIRTAPKLDRDKVLDSLEFDRSWVEILR